MNRLRQLREERGLTQAQLGSQLNVQGAAISKYELGAVSLTDDLISRLCVFFDCSSDYLLGLSNVRGGSGEIKLPLTPQEMLINELSELSLDELKDLRSYIRFLKIKRDQ